MDVESPTFRFLLLLFNCMLTFGSYFCFDMPSVLQTEFTSPRIDCLNESSQTAAGNCTPCADCLDMDEDDYNLLYAIYAWTNAVLVIGAGYLIDKLGGRVGALIFSALTFLGSALFALGGILPPSSSAMLPIMLGGRLIFGAGNGALTVAQNRLTAFWFHEKELAMAFGITLAFSRLGSVLNFFVTESLRDLIGLQFTLWFGAGLCLLGFLSAVFVCLLDRWGERQLGLSEELKQESRQLHPRDVCHLPLQYWLLALSIMFYYNSVFPFVADASKFIHDKYGYNKKVSAYMAGAVYDFSMIASPFLGRIIDVIGKRGVLALLCNLLTIPVFGLLAFTHVFPLICTLWLGVTYSFAAASMWPSLPLVVPRATLGTALGLTTSLQMLGIGLCNLAVGQILGHDTTLPVERLLNKWKLVMLFLLGNTALGVVVTVILNIVDKRRGGVLNQSKREKQLSEDLARQEEDAVIHASIEQSVDERSPLLRPSGQSSINC